MNERDKIVEKTDGKIMSVGNENVTNARQIYHYSHIQAHIDTNTQVTRRPKKMLRKIKIIFMLHL